MNLFDFYTVDEVAEKSGMNIGQVLRLGMSGTIIFSILKHSPRNYEQIDEYVDDDGNDVKRTRSSETSTIIGNKRPGLQVKYISTEDVINTVTNEAENKKTLIRGLFETRALDPKKGELMLNCPISICQKDLIIDSDEWSLFQNGKGKDLEKYIPLKYPEKVTIPWLIKNVSFPAWIAVGGIAVAIFMAGVYVVETGIYKEIKKQVLPLTEIEKHLRN